MSEKGSSEQNVYDLVAAQLHCFAIKLSLLILISEYFVWHIKFKAILPEFLVIVSFPD